MPVCFIAIDVAQDFIEAVHMGSHVAGSEPGTYAPALGVGSMGYLPVGPPRSSQQEAHYRAAGVLRYGHYTDDTNTALALASSLVEHERLDGAKCARKYADFFMQSDPVRGYPDSAKKVMLDVLEVRTQSLIDICQV